MFSNSFSSLIWPETVIFWGAGATAFLGMPTTGQMGNIVKILATSNDLDATFNDEKLRCFSIIKEELSKFLKSVSIPLEESNTSNIDDFRLRQIYDFDALKLLAQKLKSLNDGAIFLTNLYNLIDYGIVNNTGIIAEKNKEKVVLLAERLRRARKLLDYLSVVALSSTYEKILNQNSEKLDYYIHFCDHLAELMNEEGVSLAELAAANGKDDSFFATRAFYMFSYAIVSMNYEPLFLWLLMNAHKVQNSKGSCVGLQNRQIKLFNDFAIFFGIRQIEKSKRDKTDDIWYPCNEPVAQRLNEHPCEHSLYRIGKFFYPHGNVNFRECPSCGKLNISFGDKWSSKSETLFAPNPFLDKLSNLRNRDKFEDFAFSKGEYDVQRCAFCGEMLHIHNSAIVMQTAFKGNHPSFIEEIQCDMKICVQNAKHIVLMGYSLPVDDTIWRSAMVAKGQKKYCSVVTYIGKFAKADYWFYDNDLDKLLGEKEAEAVQNAINVFGKKNVRVFAGGIPKVWEKGVDAVRELLYPKQWFLKSIAEERLEKYHSRILIVK